MQDIGRQVRIMKDRGRQVRIMKDRGRQVRIMKDIERSDLTFSLGEETMKYIEAPEAFRGEKRPAAGTEKFGENLERLRCIYLAGEITDCPDWQQEMRDLLVDRDDLVLFNPRRADFPIGDPDAAKEQITWEFVHLESADEILFWFPCETLCPIVLFELGKWSAGLTQYGKKIYVGVHPEYQRRQDVEIQLSLARPEVEVVYSLQELAEQTKAKYSMWTSDRLGT